MYVNANGCSPGYYPTNTKWGASSTLLSRSAAMPQGFSSGFTPVNTKWASSSGLSGLLPGGGFRGLGYFRPNFAMARGNYPGGGHFPGLGDDTTDSILSTDPTTLLLGGVAALGLAMILMRRRSSPAAKPRRRRRRAAPSGGWRLLS